MIEQITTPKKLKVPKKLKALVIDAIKRHSWNIGVSNYTGDILYMEEDVTQDSGTVNAECVVDRRYLHATFKLYPVFIKNWQHDGDPYVENTIAHEVAHIATAHLYQVAVATYRDEGEMKDAWETLTQVVGQLSKKLDLAHKPKRV